MAWLLVLTPVLIGASRAHALRSAADRDRARRAARARPRAPRPRLPAARPRHDDEALPGPARGGRARLARRPRRVARGAARRRDLRGGRRGDLAAAGRRGLRRLVCVSPRPAGADRVDGGERAVRARRLGRHRDEPAPGPLQVKRPGRRPRRGRRGAVRRPARARPRGDRAARGAPAEPAPHGPVRLRGAAGLRHARQGVLAAVRHLARAVRGARVGVGAAGGRAARRPPRSCSPTSSSRAATSTSSTSGPMSWRSSPRATSLLLVALVVLAAPLARSPRAEVRIGERT